MCPHTRSAALARSNMDGCWDLFYMKWISGPRCVLCGRYTYEAKRSPSKVVQHVGECEGAKGGEREECGEDEKRVRNEESLKRWKVVRNEFTPVQDCVFSIWETQGPSLGSVTGVSNMEEIKAWLGSNADRWDARLADDIHVPIPIAPEWEDLGIVDVFNDLSWIRVERLLDHVQFVNSSTGQTIKREEGEDAAGFRERILFQLRQSIPGLLEPGAQAEGLAWEDRIGAVGLRAGSTRGIHSVLGGKMPFFPWQMDRRPYQDQVEDNWGQSVSVPLFDSFLIPAGTISPPHLDGPSPFQVFHMKGIKLWFLWPLNERNRAHWREWWEVRGGQDGCLSLLGALECLQGLNVVLVQDGESFDVGCGMIHGVVSLTDSWHLTMDYMEIKVEDEGWYEESKGKVEGEGKDYLDGMVAFFDFHKERATEVGFGAWFQGWKGLEGLFWARMMENVLLPLKLMVQRRKQKWLHVLWGSIVVVMKPWDIPPCDRQMRIVIQVDWECAKFGLDFVESILQQNGMQGGAEFSAFKLRMRDTWGKGDSWCETAGEL
ncbi:hypothetical protein BS47DRAFT_1362067 [Hydnum rufescens UP504]|uniref:Uncharacterized protein n=1 Tax=Hydnum rufescens UP504 TaxID=1448309 RepID=A0A9P6AXU4_9AGAM|nr:hypothetical protein BS47DRAFT_1362067 [Hydnum rufescens UP504]